MATKTDRTLNAATAGISWQITPSTSHTQGPFLEVAILLAPGFKGLPRYCCPGAEPSFQALDGTLDLWLEGHWQLLGAAQQATLPAGGVHSLRNPHHQPVRLVSTISPALNFEVLIGQLQWLLKNGQLELPTRRFSSLVRLVMLVVVHVGEVQPAKPSHGFIRFLAFISSLLRYTIPDC